MPSIHFIDVIIVVVVTRNKCQRVPNIPKLLLYTPWVIVVVIV